MTEGSLGSVQLPSSLRKLGPIFTCLLGSPALAIRDFQRELPAWLLYFATTVTNQSNFYTTTADLADCAQPPTRTDAIPAIHTVALQRTEHPQHPQPWPHHHPQRSHPQVPPPSPFRANAPVPLSPSQTAPQHPNHAANPPQQARPHPHTLYAKPRSHHPKATAQITMQCTRPRAVPTSATLKSRVRSQA
jgi:hypothetical protein